MAGLAYSAAGSFVSNIPDGWRSRVRLERALWYHLLKSYFVLTISCTKDAAILLQAEWNLLFLSPLHMSATDFRHM